VREGASLARRSGPAALRCSCNAGATREDNQFMTERQRATSANAARIAVAGMIIAGGALAMAAQAGADPAVPYPTPVPADPGAPPAPGQPVLSEDTPMAAPAPPPAGPPTVPEIANPVYGSGKYGSGPLSTLRDLWHQAQDPSQIVGSGDAMPEGAAPPPGAGPAPQLPPGYISLNNPESNGPPPAPPAQGGPALPPGYYPLNGPPPPGYDTPAAPASGAPPTIVPAPPTP